ncbi:MAG: rhodanese-like domain-containing protein [bacterium]
MKSGTDLINESKGRIKQVDATEALALHGRGGVTFLDVRDLQEVNLGKVPNAVHISRGNLETKIEAIIPRDAEVVIYCASGNRSAFAADTMQQMGYTKVCSLAGGFRGWAEAGGDID